MYKNELQSTAADSKESLGERLLWANLIKDAAAAIRKNGDRHAIEFFSTEHYRLLCFYLGLNAEAIRERVLSPGFRTTSQPRVYKRST